jgi:hypothetical protein
MHRHVLQNQGVEHGRVTVFEMGQVDVLFNILVLGMELSKTSKLDGHDRQALKTMNPRVGGHLC